MYNRLTAYGVACLLAGCAPSMPDSNPAGVGFKDYDRFQTERARRDAELQAMRPAAAPTDAVIGQETLAVLAATGRAPVGGGSAAATPTGGATGAGSDAPLTAIAMVSGNPNISDEQNFDAVAGRQSIESDADRLRRLRQARQEVAPVPVPERATTGRPNVVAYALATRNALGEELYGRSGAFSTSRFQRNCAKYANWDLAQEDFLANGGPERDRSGLDPDGDGFACFWDPTPYRAAQGG